MRTRASGSGRVLGRFFVGERHVVAATPGGRELGCDLAAAPLTEDDAEVDFAEAGEILALPIGPENFFERHDFELGLRLGGEIGGGLHDLAGVERRVLEDSGKGGLLAALDQDGADELHAVGVGKEHGLAQVDRRLGVHRRGVFVEHGGLHGFDQIGSAFDALAGGR